MIPYIWAIYDHPKDYLNGYIARKWDCNTFPPKPTEDTLTGETLEEVQIQLMQLDGGSLRSIPRFPTDDPCLVEVWL